MQFDDADLVLVNPANNDTMDSDVVVARPIKKMKTVSDLFFMNIRFFYKKIIYINNFFY